MVVTAAVAAAVMGLTWWSADGVLPGQPVANVQGAVLERGALVPDAKEALQRSVLRLHSEGCGSQRQATVTVVQRGGRTVGLTNQHAVLGTDQVVVDGVGGEVAVDGRVDGRDVAELDGDELLAGGARPMAVGPRPVLGAQVVVAGYPAGSFRAVTGHVRAVEQRQGYGGVADVLVLDVEAVPGISGGVVVDIQGRAVALVAARDPATHDVVAYPLDVIGLARRSGPRCR